jgi:maleate isomerase
LEKKFLSSSGFRVVGLKGLGLKDNLKIGGLTSEAAYRLIMELDYHTADGIFLSCTNLATAGIIDKLERITRKSVISSNTATMWAMLKQGDCSTEIKGFGRLLGTI